MPEPTQGRRMTTGRLAASRQAPGFDAGAVLRGFIVATALIIVLSFILAMALRWSPLSEANLSVMGGGIALLAAFAGGGIAGRRAAGNGWLHGGAVGLLVGALVSILGATLGAEGWMALIVGLKMGLGFVAGMAGGVFGVNL